MQVPLRHALAIDHRKLELRRRLEYKERIIWSECREHGRHTMTPRTNTRLDANTDDQRTATLETTRIMIPSDRRQESDKADGR